MRKYFGLALAAMISLAASHAAAAVIYQENFGGAGAALNGKAVGPTAANWAAGSVYLDNGAVGTVVGSATGQAAHLPFAPAKPRRGPRRPIAVGIDRLTELALGW